VTQPLPLIAHLLELRNRLLRAMVSVLVVFLCLAYFAQELYQLISEPLKTALPVGGQMIATDVASPFFAPFKLTLVVSFFIAIPYVLYQCWAFIAPGLYKQEKRLVAPLMISSSLLFYCGIAFAYFVIFPLAFPFFVGVAPEGVMINTDINSYLNFVLKLFFAFGVSFQIPIAIILLCWTGFTTPESLREKRAYVIVAVFVIGMLMTPPDPISQTLLAIPMWLLFELGVFAGSLYGKSKNQEEEESVS